MSLDMDSSAYFAAREAYLKEIDRVVEIISDEINRIEHLPIPTFEQWLSGEKFPELADYEFGGSQ